MAAFDVLEISPQGQGAHAAMPHLGQDVLSAAASLQMQLQSIVSRSLNAGVVSVIEVQGGDTWNVLPYHAVLHVVIHTKLPVAYQVVACRCQSDG